MAMGLPPVTSAVFLIAKKIWYNVEEYLRGYLRNICLGGISEIPLLPLGG
jgi:hypothetical protein